MKHIALTLILACAVTGRQTPAAEVLAEQVVEEKKAAPVLHVLSAAYKCPGTTPAENEKYAVAFEQQVVGIAGVDGVQSEVTAAEIKIHITLKDNADYEAVLRHFAAALKQFSINDPELRKLSELWRKGSSPDRKLENEQKQQVEELFTKLLPSGRYIGADKEWKVSYIDSDAEDILSVNLNKKGDSSSGCMWFHILYTPGEESSYGSEDFGDYRGMGAKGVHYFIKVGNVEIRAVASSDEYKNDEAIKGMLNAFKLKAIESL